jgi:hypothetical protein
MKEPFGAVDFGAAPDYHRPSIKCQVFEELSINGRKVFGRNVTV